MTRTTTLCLSLALLAIPLVTLVAAPASAHICTAQFPAQSCGDCRPGTGLYHDHNYNNGSNYCNSVGYLCAQVGADCAVGARLELTSALTPVLP